jgi:hypothetical protein
MGRARHVDAIIEETFVEHGGFRVDGFWTLGPSRFSTFDYMAEVARRYAADLERRIFAIRPPYDQRV